MKRKKRKGGKGEGIRKENGIVPIMTVKWRKNAIADGVAPLVTYSLLAGTPL